MEIMRWVMDVFPSSSAEGSCRGDLGFRGDSFKRCIDVESSAESGSEL